MNFFLGEGEMEWGNIVIRGCLLNIFDEKCGSIWYISMFEFIDVFGKNFNNYNYKFKKRFVGFGEIVMLFFLESCFFMRSNGIFEIGERINNKECMKRYWIKIDL